MERNRVKRVLSPIAFEKTADASAKGQSTPVKFPVQDLLDAKSPLMENVKRRRRTMGSATRISGSELVKENLEENSIAVPLLSLEKPDVKQKPIVSVANRPWAIDDFTVGKPIGKGKFGNVYIANQKLTNTQVALKVLFKAQIQADGCTHMIRREVEIQSRLKHKNIVQLIGYFHDPKNVYLILEYVANGELFKSISRNGAVGISEDLCRRYMRQIVSAVSHMHARHVYHRDIKPENILIHEDGSLCVADFGWAVHAPPPNTTRFTLCGTPEYLSPEMISQKGHDGSVDLWALGIFMFELLFGRTPFMTKKKPTSGDLNDIESAHLEARQATYDKILQHDGALSFPRSYTTWSTSVHNGESAAAPGNKRLSLTDRRSSSARRLSLAAASEPMVLEEPKLVEVEFKVTGDAKAIVMQFLQPDPKRRLSCKEFLSLDWTAGDL